MKQHVERQCLMCTNKFTVSITHSRKNCSSVCSEKYSKLAKKIYRQLLRVKEDRAYYSQLPIVRSKRIACSKRYQKTPKAKEKRRAYYQRPYVKAKQKAYYEQYMSIPENKVKRQVYYKKPDVVAKQKEYDQRPNVLIRKNELQRLRRERLKNDIISKKMTNSAFTKDEYTKDHRVNVV